MTRVPLSGISCTRGRTERTSRRTLRASARTSGESGANSASTAEDQDLVTSIELQTQRQQDGDERDQNGQERALRRLTLVLGVTWQLECSQDLQGPGVVAVIGHRDRDHRLREAG